MQVIQFIKQLWLSWRSNPIVAAAEGGASGALFKIIGDIVLSQHVDLSSAGLKGYAWIILSGAYAGVKLLYRPAPGAVPVKQ
jgi:hypothetical protein